MIVKLMRRKTRKAIRKSVGKVIHNYGPQIAAGLAGGIASTLATLAGTEAPGSKGKKSNLAKLSEDVSEKLTGSTDDWIRASSSDEPAKKKKHRDPVGQMAEDDFEPVR
ncbi:MAG TPA: hypothetical protein VE505_13715 [Vicinamibacterales bacterium]|nr:hypothetical protein [Vicinamibacterales bacterium]